MIQPPQQIQGNSFSPGLVPVFNYNPQPAMDIPQGTGSGLDSDKVDGFNAARNPAPNQLIPLGPDGLFPQSVIPTAGGGGPGFILGNGAPTDKNVLIADGTDWESVSVSGDLTITADTGTFHVVGVGNVTTGTLSVTHGGTGLTACTTGDLLLGSGSNTLAVLNIGSSGKVLTSNGTTASWQTASSSSPGGANTDLQYNDSGAFGGDGNLTWDKTNRTLLISNGSSTIPLVVNGSTNLDFYMYTSSNHAAWNFGTGIYPSTAVPKWQAGLNVPDNLGEGATNSFFIYNYTTSSNDFIIRSSDGRVHVVNNFLVDGASTLSGAVTLGSTLKMFGDTTGAGTTVGFGTNSPASTLTAPYTWLKFISSDGSTVYCPAYK